MQYSLNVRLLRSREHTPISMWSDQGPQNWDVYDLVPLPEIFSNRVLRCVANLGFAIAKSAYYASISSLAILLSPSVQTSDYLIDLIPCCRLL